MSFDESVAGPVRILYMPSLSTQHGYRTLPALAEKLGSVICLEDGEKEFTPGYMWKDFGVAITGLELSCDGGLVVVRTWVPSWHLSEHDAKDLAGPMSVCFVSKVNGNLYARLYDHALYGSLGEPIKQGGENVTTQVKFACQGVGRHLSASKKSVEVWEESE